MRIIRSENLCGPRWHGIVSGFAYLIDGIVLVLSLGYVGSNFSYKVAKWRLFR